MFKAIVFTVLALAIMSAVGMLRFRVFRGKVYRQFSEEFFKCVATVVTTLYVFVCIKANLENLDNYVQNVVRSSGVSTVIFAVAVTICLFVSGFLFYKVSVLSGNLKVRMAIKNYSAAETV
jgi:hypothetical protein